MNKAKLLSTELTPYPKQDPASGIPHFEAQLSPASMREGEFAVHIDDYLTNLTNLLCSEDCNDAQRFQRQGLIAMAIAKQLNATQSFGAGWLSTIEVYLPPSFHPLIHILGNIDQPSGKMFLSNGRYIFDKCLTLAAMGVYSSGIFTANRVAEPRMVGNLVLLQGEQNHPAPINNVQGIRQNPDIPARNLICTDNFQLLSTDLMFPNISIDGELTSEFTPVLPGNNGAPADYTPRSYTDLVLSPMATRYPAATPQAFNQGARQERVKEVGKWQPFFNSFIFSNITDDLTKTWNVAAFQPTVKGTNSQLVIRREGQEIQTAKVLSDVDMHLAYISGIISTVWMVGYKIQTAGSNLLFV